MSDKYRAGISILKMFCAGCRLSLAMLANTSRPLPCVLLCVGGQESQPANDPGSVYGALASGASARQTALDSSARRATSETSSPARIGFDSYIS